MGTNPGVDIRIGWDESEQKEFMKAIRQPLMVQTPLQVVIENLFQRLQSQATFMQQIKEKMERIAVKDVTADELLARIKLLESQQGDAAGPKLNPFNQQEILARVEALEQKLSDSGPDGPRSAGPRRTSGDEGPDLETRLNRLEKRLTGVYNLPGKLVAIEQIAAGLGVAIPDLEYPTGGAPPSAAAGTATGTGTAAGTAAGMGAGMGPGMGAGMGTGRVIAAAASPATGGGGGGVGPLPPLQAWRPPVPGGQTFAGPNHLAPLEWSRPGGDEGASAGVGASAGAAGRLPPRSGSPGPDGGPDAGPHVRVSSPGHSPRLVGTPTSPSGMASPSSAPGMGGLGSAGGPVSARKIVQLGQEVNALRSDNELLKETVDSLVQQVAGLRSGLGSNAVESLSRLQQVEEGVHALKAQVADLATARRDAAARTGSEVTFADLSLLRSQAEGWVAEVRAQAASAAALAERDLPALAARVDELGEALKKKGEPRDIDALFHERINSLEGAMADMKTELLGSIEAALESAVKVDDLQALEEVLEAKAPAEALRLLQQQTAALGQAVAGIGDAIALRPELGDALRGAGGGGGAAGAGGPGGPLATKLRCLTCDQPIRQGALSISAGGSAATTAKGSFLPRLESMPAKDGPPGGPGLMIAELRASKEERLAGGTAGRGPGGAGVSALKAGELEDYANGVGGLGLTGSGAPRDGSPGRAVERSRATRVAVGTGLGKPAGGPPVNGAKPVFL